MEVVEAVRTDEENNALRTKSPARLLSFIVSAPDLD